MDQDTAEKEREILEKVVKHPYITTTVLAHSLGKNAFTTNKLMEKFRKEGLVKYARNGLPKSWLLTDTAIERYSFQQDMERKPRRDQGQGGNQGNNKRRGNNQRRGPNQNSRRDNNQGRRDNQGRNNNQGKRDNNQGRRDNKQGRRDNNQSRGRQGQNKPKQEEEDKEQNPEANNGNDQRKGSKKERQDKINELFEFFKEHSEHSFTSAEIAPEFGINVSHLNSLMYELLGYGDVMKQFNNEEQQLVWYLADCHLETSNTAASTTAVQH